VANLGSWLGRPCHARASRPRMSHFRRGRASSGAKLAPKGRCSWCRCWRRPLWRAFIWSLGRTSLCRPFRAFCNLDLEPRARALGYLAGPLRGPWFRSRNEL